MAIRSLWLFVAVGLILAPSLYAQGGVAEERSDQDTAFSEPDAMNVAQKARLSFGAAERQMAQARKIEEKIAQESDAKSRAKLETKREKAYSAAVEDYREGLAYEPTSTEGWAGLGTAYRWLGKYQESLLAHVEGMKTGDAESANFLGWTETLMDGMMFGNATAAYDQFAAENPERAQRMMGVMESWLAKRQQDPGDVDPANLDRLGEWIASKKQ
jgi:cytochrome c-type biogenesis protein CcmH/NrfG